ncbi:hypothetical protein CJ260_00510 [Megasphaera sp. ASD88]|nr:hypothetical protein CJ260_00510 [Megasphaera sp. ASD88]
MPDRFLTMREFAEHIGKSLSTVYNWKYKGYLPIVRFNKDMVDVESFFEIREGESMTKRSGISVIKRKYKAKDGTVKTYKYKKITVSKTCPIFYDYAKRLIESKVDVKAVTKEKLLTYLDNHLKKFFDKIPADEITRDYLRYVIANCEGRPEEAKQIITNTFAELVWDDYIQKDVSQGLKWPKYDKNGERIVKRKEKQLPTYDELMQFYHYMQTCKKPMTYVVLFMFCAGTSRSETLGLHKSDFNFDECYAVVNKAYTIVKKGTSGLTTTKNKYRDRKVYFPRSIVPILQKGMKSRKGIWFAGDDTGKKPIDPNNFSTRYFSDIGKKLKISVNISTHMARHIYITEAINAGVPPTEVMRQVGHRDLTMIMRVYTHYMAQSKPSQKMSDFMDNMAATVFGQQIDAPTPRPPAPKGHKVISVDFTAKLAKKEVY